MKVFSHRGLHHHLPENTLAAFEAAIALEVDGIETDIRLTRDGVPILYHDPQTPDGMEICDLTQAEISERTGYPVPSLQEAIALTQKLGHDFCWNLEIKTQNGFAATTQLLQDLQPQTQVLLTSFWHDGMVAMVQDHENLALNAYHYGLLWASHPFGFEIRQWFDTYPCIRTQVFNQERLTPDLVQDCHRKGFQVAAYSDRTPQDQAKLKQWGIDILITDHPDRLCGNAR